MKAKKALSKKRAAPLTVQALIKARDLDDYDDAELSRRYQLMGVAASLEIPYESLSGVMRKLLFP